MKIVEFCEKCGGILVPYREINTTILKCNLCNEKLSIKNELEKEYPMKKTIEHLKGSEFINLEKMKNWRKKEKN